MKCPKDYFYAYKFFKNYISQPNKYTNQKIFYFQKIYNIYFKFFKLKRIHKYVKFNKELEYNNRIKKFI